MQTVNTVVMSSTSESLLQFSSKEFFFLHLGALLQYAHSRGRNENKNENPIYGPLNFVLSTFSTSATVTISGHKNVCLGCFPQRSIKLATGEYCTPDFTVLLARFDSANTDTSPEIGDIRPLIWEAKPGPDSSWFGPFGNDGPQQPCAPNSAQFFAHFEQATIQSFFATALLQRRSYVVLSVGIWFILIRAPENSGEDSRDQTDEYLKVPISPIVNGNWTGFSNPFLYALDLCFTNTGPGVTINPHVFFQLLSGSKGKKKIIESFREEGELTNFMEDYKRWQQSKRIDTAAAVGGSASDESGQSTSPSDWSKDNPRDAGNVRPAAQGTRPNTRSRNREVPDPDSTSNQEKDIIFTDITCTIKVTGRIRKGGSDDEEEDDGDDGDDEKDSDDQDGDDEGKRR